MRIRTSHLLSELLIRSRLALKESLLVEIVESHQFPSGAQKTAKMLGFSEYAYSVWALSALKRDYPKDYDNLQEVQNFRN